jgi:hypothetical protein
MARPRVLVSSSARLQEIMKLLVCQVVAGAGVSLLHEPAVLQVLPATGQAGWHTVLLTEEIERLTYFPSRRGLILTADPPSAR